MTRYTATADAAISRSELGDKEERKLRDDPPRDFARPSRARDSSRGSAIDADMFLVRIISIYCALIKHTSLAFICVSYFLGGTQKLHSLPALELTVS